MIIAALTVHVNHSWPELGTDALAPGLNVFYGRSASGKTTIADLIAHALYGQRLASNPAGNGTAPEGEMVVEHRARQYRLRRSYDATSGERLTVAALDKSPVDEDTVRQLVACLPPSMLRPLFAIGFHESPSLEWLLSPEFSHEFRSALWRLTWAPPTVRAELRPVYARLRALEAKVTSLVDALASDKSRIAAAATTQKQVRKRRASYFLAQLTGGEFVRLRLGGATGETRVVTRGGDLLAVDTLWSTQRDQVYLSLCLALISALRRRGARLPLVLDEPFARLDARASAALVDVLDAFSRRDRQVLVFTSQREAVERFAASGATMHDIQALRGHSIDETKTALPAEDVPTRRIRRRVKSAHIKHREAG